ncbi:MAG: FkbM family methyltransferase [Proteobacteria bacterium]|nr:FkbM family methyltransferase [Pseudomonadota bacterium]
MLGRFRGEELRRAYREEWLRDHIPHFIRYEIDPLASVLESNNRIVAIDVGANKGFWSKALLTRFPGQVEHIYQIDASPENYAELTNTADSLMFDPPDFAVLTPMHFAVSDAPGDVTLYTNDDGSPIASLFPHTAAGRNTLGEMGTLEFSMTVPCQTLDNIIAIRGIERIDVLKLDIEGSELDALRGAAKSFAAGKIRSVLFEFGIHQVDSRQFFRDFWEFFQPYGFALTRVEEDCSRTPVPEYTYTMEDFTWCWNFVAIKT